MRLQDLGYVLRLDRLSFPKPWTKSAFLSELLENERAYYLVAKWGGRPVGYIGVWIIAQEGHITNIAVHPDFRRRDGHAPAEGHRGLDGRAGRLADDPARCARDLGAQRLYQRLGFRPAGIRPGVLQGQQRRRRGHVEANRWARAGLSRRPIRASASWLNPEEAPRA